MIPDSSTPPDERMLAWMEQNRRNRKIKLLERQVDAARRRGFQTTKVPLDTLVELLARLQ